MTRTRKVAALLAGLTLALSTVACADPVDVNAVADTGLNLSADQNPVRSEVNPDIAAMVPAEISADGALTVGSLVHGAPPLVMMATDNATPIGAEIDIARLVADKLGLELNIQLTSWDNWPLKVEAREYEAMHGNVGVTDERMQKFDFSSYRAAYLGFVKQAGDDLQIEDARDISGLRIAVAAGTNQERILRAWNEQLEAEGGTPAELYYYMNENDMALAVQSGRADALFNHFPGAAYLAGINDNVEIAGRVSAGWPAETLVGAAMARGSGLAPAYTAALNELIAEGTYQEALDRWGLGDEALPESTTYSLESYGELE